MNNPQFEISELLELCLDARPIDLPLVESYIQNIGPNTLLAHSSRPLPAAIIQSFAKHSVSDASMLIRYLELFLQNGFDSRHLGAPCLHALARLDNEQMLICAQLLLDNGIMMSAEEYRSLLRTVSFQCAYHDYQTQNYYLANLYFAYRQMLLEYFTPQTTKHSDIAHYTCACNKPIVNILYHKTEHPLRHIYLAVPDGILIMQNHPNIYMCSSIESITSTTQPAILTPHPIHHSVKNQLIRSISFIAPPLAPTNTALPHPSIRIHLDNSSILVKYNPRSNSLDLSLE